MTTQANRSSEIERKTRETEIRLKLNLDGAGAASIASGVGFLDHMLELFAKHALIDLEVRCAGDLEIDGHHTTEDIGICLGAAFARAIGDKSNVRRYGHSLLPMDETLVSVAVDLSGRAFFAWNVEIPAPMLGELDSELVAEFWRAFAFNAQITFHVNLHYGTNSHHIAEGVFKGVARALRDAIELDPRAPGVPSTKGSL